MTSSVIILLLERKPLPLPSYSLKFLHKFVIRLDSSLYRNIIGLFQANRLKQFASDIFHAATLAEVNCAAVIVLVYSEVKYFGFSHNCGHCCAIGFVAVCVFSELV